MSEFKITFLGTGATAPSAERNTAATLMQINGVKILFDCGEGTQRQMHRAGGLTDIDAIFLTHYHTDHILGLPGLLNTYALRDRTKPLPIYGPRPLHKNLERFDGLLGKQAKRMIRPTQLKVRQSINFNGFKVTALEADHGGAPAFGYKVEEPDRPGRFNVDLARTLGIEPGPDYGRLQAGEAVGEVTPGMVIGSPRKGRKAVLSGDTRPTQDIESAAEGADLLIHEATLLDTDDRKFKTEHTTALQAGHLGRLAGVDRLALYHIASRNTANAIQQEALKGWDGDPRKCEVAKDLDVIELFLKDE